MATKTMKWRMLMSHPDLRLRASRLLGLQTHQTAMHNPSLEQLLHPTFSRPLHLFQQCHPCLLPPPTFPRTWTSIFLPKTFLSPNPSSWPPRKPLTPLTTRKPPTILRLSLRQMSPSSSACATSHLPMRSWMVVYDVECARAYPTRLPLSIALIANPCIDSDITPTPLCRTPILLRTPHGL
jgi:hypothetical protein